MFHFARLKLTAWYLLIIMTVSLAFSAILYQITMNEVNRFAAEQRLRIQRRLQIGDFLHQSGLGPEPPIIMIDVDLIDEVRRRTLVALGTLNGIILITAGGAGYFLAGRTLRPIQEMVQEQNRFISDASHELKTPLTALKSTMEVFLRDKKPNLKEAQAIIQGSLEETNNLQRLSEALLSLAQFQEGGNGNYLQPLDISRSLKKIIDQMSPLAKQKHITIESELTPLTVKGDLYSLSQVWSSILDNAIKYSPEQSKIVVRSIKKDKMAAVMIHDQGIGIARADIAHIFDRFYRANMARTKTDTNGFGLGLSIAQKIIVTHKGSIRVESTPGKGSTFIITIPLLVRAKK